MAGIAPALATAIAASIATAFAFIPAPLPRIALTSTGDASRRLTFPPTIPPKPPQCTTTGASTGPREGSHAAGVLRVEEPARAAMGAGLWGKSCTERQVTS